MWKISVAQTLILIFIVPNNNIGPFHKRFSSIVGPNGSGKSNVIDALLFVFGKRAKQLRLNKVSELIHKSARYPNLEYARVAVNFQLIKDFEEDEDAFEVVAGSEFVVTRIAYLNNQSKYTVDGDWFNFHLILITTIVLRTWLTLLFFFDQAEILLIAMLAHFFAATRSISTTIVSLFYK